MLVVDKGVEIVDEEPVMETKLLELEDPAPISSLDPKAEVWVAPDEEVD